MKAIAQSLRSFLKRHSLPASKAMAAPESQLEALEPRVLFSAAPVEAPADVEDSSSAQVQTIDGDTSTQQGQVADSTGSGQLDQATVEAIAAAAKQHWIDAGISGAQLDALNAATYQIADLGGNYLSSAEGNVITIDDDAAGGSWFVDETPLENEEFETGESAALIARDGTSAEGRIDLLSAVIHEQGHILGLNDDDDSDGHGFMAGLLDEGERLLPTAGAAEGATSGSLTGIHYATSAIPAGPTDVIFGLDQSTISENQSVVLNGSFTLGSDSTNSVSIDWGDGTIDHQLVTGGATTFGGTHQYLDNGDYTISVSVKSGSLGLGLVGLWNFDDGTATDLSGNGNNGTGGTINGADSPFGSGQAFADGSISVPSSTSLESPDDQVTVAFWVKGDPTSADWSRTITKVGGPVGWHVGKYSNSTDINIRTDTVGDGGGNNRNILFAGDGVFDNTWHHVVFTLDNGTAKEFVDGTLVQTQTYPHGDGLSNTGSLVMGSSGLVGGMDDVAVWNRILTDTEIAQIAEAAIEIQAAEVVSTGIRVTDVAPVIDRLQALPGSAPGEVVLQVDFTDPGSLDEHKAVIDWGDGSGTTEVLLIGGARTLQSNHAYASATDHTINVTLFDRMGEAVGIWSFDEGNGNDSSGNDNNGTSGAYSNDVATIFGNGMSLDGSGSPVQIANSPSLEGVNDQMSLSFWIKGDDSAEPNWVRVIRKGSEGSNAWLVTRYQDTDDLLIRTDTTGTGGRINNNQHDGQGGPILDGQWHHVAYVLDNGISREYVDGVQTNQENYSHGDGLSNTQPLTIGTAINATLLDEVILYDRALTPQQIAALYGAMDVAAARDSASVVATAGSVAISDSTPGGVNNDYHLVLDPTGSGSGPEYVITDPTTGLVTRVLASSVTGPITITGSDGDDTLTVDLSGGNVTPAIFFDGGAGGNDDLVIVGGNTDTATYEFTNENDGSIQIEGQGLITYVGLEPITSTITASDVILNYTGGAETITITDNGSTITVDSTLGELVTFNNPTNSLIINAGTDDIVIFANALNASGFDLTINGATTNLDQSINLGTGDLVFDGDLNQGAANVILVANDITFAGTTTLDSDPSVNLFGLDANGTATIDAGATFNVNGGRFQLQGGTHLVNDGELITGLDALFPIFANGNDADNRITNNGTFTHNSAQLRLYVEITNTATGTFQINRPTGTAETEFKVPGGNGPGGVIRNQGTMHLSNGAVQFNEAGIAGVGGLINENGGVINVTGANTTFAEGASFTNEAGGVVNLDGAKLTLNGAAVSFVNEAGGEINLQGVTTIDLQAIATLTNQGTVSWVFGENGNKTIQGGGTFLNEGVFYHDHVGDDNLQIVSSTFHNAATGTFEFRNGGDLNLMNTSASFLNEGTMAKTAAATINGQDPSFVFSQGGVFTNSGDLEVSAGHLNIAGGLSSTGYVSTGGNFVTTGSGLLSFSGKWSELTGVSSIGGGEVQISNQNPAGAAGTTFLAGAATTVIDVTGDGLLWGNGSGGSDVDAGANTIRNEGLLRIVGTGADHVGGIFENTGTLDLASGAVLSLDGASFTNTGTANLIGSFTFDGAGAFTTSAGGVFELGTTAGNKTLTLNNGGGVAIDGTANLNQNLTLNGTGTFMVGATGTLELTPVTGNRSITLNNPGIVNEGTTNFDADGNITLAGTGGFTNNGLFNHSYGGSNDNFVLSGSVVFTNSATGTYDIGGVGDIQIINSGRFDNAGLLRKSASGGGTQDSAVFSNLTPTLGNDGTFHNLAGGTIESQAGILHIASTGGNTSDAGASWLANGGVIKLGALWTGTIAGTSTGSQTAITTTSNGAFEDDFTVGAGGVVFDIGGLGGVWNARTISTAAGDVVNEGVFNIAPLTTKTLAGGGEFVTASGATTTFVTGGVVNTTGGSAFRVESGGTVDGNGTFNGAFFVEDGGTIAPGNSPGLISTGNLDLDGIYEVEITGDGGPGDANGHDQINVTGTVGIDAGTAVLTLDITGLGATEITGGDSFVIIANDGVDAVTGTFSNYAEGDVVVTNVDATGINLTITYTGGDGNDVALVAQPAETTVEIIGNDLVITDAAGGVSVDDWTLSVSGGNLNLVDNDGKNIDLLSALHGGTGDGTGSVSVSLASFSGNVIVRALGGDDVIAIEGLDLTGTQGLVIDDGAGDDIVTFQTTASTLVNGVIEIGAETVGVSAAVASGGADITLTTDNVDLSASLDAGTGRVEVASLTAGRGIHFGDTELAGELNLSDTEFDQITAGVLQIGDATAGRIEFSGTGNGGLITPANVDTVHLITANFVDDGDDNSNGGGIRVANLAIEAGGATLTASDNAVEMYNNNSAVRSNVETLAIRSDEGRIRFRDSGQVSGLGLTIGAVDGVMGILNLTDSTIANRERIDITANTGDLVISDIGAAFEVQARRDVFIRAAGNTSAVIVDAGATLGHSEAGALTLRGDNIDLNGNIDSVGRTVALEADDAGSVINVGSGETDVFGDDILEIDQDELNRITANLVQIGRHNYGTTDGTGDLTITSAISLTNANDLRLRSNTTVSQTSGSTISVRDLGVNARGDVTLTEENLISRNVGIDVQTDNAAVSGFIQFTNTDADWVVNRSANVANVFRTDNGDITVTSFGIVNVDEEQGSPAQAGVADPTTELSAKTMGFGTGSITYNIGDGNSAGADFVLNDAADGVPGVDFVDVEADGDFTINLLGTGDSRIQLGDSSKVTVGGNITFNVNGIGTANSRVEIQGGATLIAGGTIGVTVQADGGIFRTTSDDGLSAIIDASGGTFTIDADRIDIEAGASIDITGQNLIITPFQSGERVNLGDTGTGTGIQRISNAELATISGTGGLLILGDADTGSITVTDAIDLSVDTELSNEGQSININATVDGAHSLSLNNTSGVTTISASIGAGTALSSLSTDATGSTIINDGVGVFTTGDQTYLDDLIIGTAGTAGQATASSTGGTITLDSTSKLFIDLEGSNTPGIGGHDQLIIVGDLAISGTLSLEIGYTAGAGDSFIIVDNQGANQISGTFSGLAEGDYFTATGVNGAANQLFQVSYQGNDGNDIVLTRAPDPTTSIEVDASGNVTVTDDLGDNTEDNLTVKVEGGFLVITDPDNVIGSTIPGSSQSDLHTVRIPVAGGEFTGNLFINTGDAD
ncbi:MAG: LEPR-XLL domain-containing protein, partial [Verrucomicrobiae bacterium]|nr:LEPR-XLL domain-containing protein [Verrucomicrobiae bacterium]